MLDMLNIESGELLFFKQNNGRMFILNKTLQFFKQENIVMFLGCRAYPENNQEENYINTIWVMDVLLRDGTRAAIPFENHIIPNDILVRLEDELESFHEEKENIRFG